MKEILEDFHYFSKESKAFFVEIGNPQMDQKRKEKKLNNFEKKIGNLIESERFLILDHENSLFIFHNISEDEGNRLFFCS